MIDFKQIHTQPELAMAFLQYHIDPNSYTNTVIDAYSDIAGYALMYNDQNLISLIDKHYPHIFPEYIKEIKKDYADDSHNIKTNLAISSFSVENSAISFRPFYNIVQSFIFLYQQKNEPDYKNKLYILLSQRLDEGVLASRGNNYDYTYLENILTLLNETFPDKKNSQEFLLNMYFFDNVFKYTNNINEVQCLHNICKLLDIDFFSEYISYKGLTYSSGYLDLFLKQKGINALLNLPDYDHDLKSKERIYFYKGKESFFKEIFKLSFSSLDHSEQYVQNTCNLLKVIEKHDLLQYIPKESQEAKDSILNMKLFFTKTHYNFLKEFSAKNAIFCQEDFLNSKVYKTDKETLSNIKDYVFSFSNVFSEACIMHLNYAYAKQYDLDFYTDFLNSVSNPDFFLKELISKLINTTNPELKEEQEYFISAITKQSFLDNFKANLDNLSYSTGKSSSIVQKNAIENKLHSYDYQAETSSKKRL